jgi:hypothetical protein
MFQQSGVPLDAAVPYAVPAEAYMHTNHRGHSWLDDQPEIELLTVWKSDILCFKVSAAGDSCMLAPSVPIWGPEASHLQVRHDSLQMCYGNGGEQRCKELTFRPCDARCVIATSGFMRGIWLLEFPYVVICRANFSSYD